jgi:hypothetical protein
MNDQQRIDNAIETRLNQKRETAAREQAQREKMQGLLEDAHLWEKVPDDITDETIIALVVLSRIDPFVVMNVNRDFIRDMNTRFLPEMNQKNPMRYVGILGQVENINFTISPTEEPSVEMIAIPPEQDGGDWIIVAVPVVVDENYQVSVPEIMPVDMNLALQVFPPEGDMSAAFNTTASGLFLPAGTPGKPLALVYQPDSDGPKKMILSGYMGVQENLIKLIVGAEPFHVGPEPFDLDADWNAGFPPEMRM